MKLKKSDFSNVKKTKKRKKYNYTTMQELKRRLETTKNDLLLRAKSSFTKVRNAQLELQ